MFSFDFLCQILKQKGFIPNVFNFRMLFIYSAELSRFDQWRTQGGGEGDPPPPPGKKRKGKWEKKKEKGGKKK